MIESVRINVASLPDRDDLVGEIWFGDVEFAEVVIENRHLQIEIFPNPDGGNWNLSWKNLIDVVERAKIKLVEITGAVIE